jgi:YndJ-like protein
VNSIPTGGLNTLTHDFFRRRSAGLAGDPDHRNFAASSAFAGAFAWLALAVCWPCQGVPAMAGLGVVVSLGPLVLVPMGAALRRPTFHVARVAEDFAFRFAFPAALAAALAVRTPAGPVAVALSVPWLIVSLLFAGSGTLEILRHRHMDFEWAPWAVGRWFLPAGAFSITMHEAEWNFGFDPVTVFLCAVHFHFAGFAASLISAETVRCCSGGPLIFRRTAKGGALLIAAAPALVAAGYCTTRRVEVAGACVLEFGVCLEACALLGLSTFAGIPAAARACYATAGTGVGATMAFAAAYSFGRWTGDERISVPWMAVWHGWFNAAGFYGLGLLGHWLASKHNPASPPGLQCLDKAIQ